jgi:hypothetical protein
MLNRLGCGSCVTALTGTAADKCSQLRERGERVESRARVIACPYGRIVSGGTGFLAGLLCEFCDSPKD